MTIGGGVLNREVNGNGADDGSLFFVRGSHARAVNDRLAYRISTGTYVSDALARPNGLHSQRDEHTDYPAYANTGTSQPKVDVRVDYDFPDGQRKLQFSGGFAGTDGIMHTGIGPFDIDGGAKLGYWKLDFTRQAFKLQAFMNTLDGIATNMVSVDPAGATDCVSTSARARSTSKSGTAVVAARQARADLRRQPARRIGSISRIAPGENGRTEGGGYIQDEILLHDKVPRGGRRPGRQVQLHRQGRVLAARGARGQAAAESHSVRVSYNRAFRAPSMVNNNLDTTIGTPLPLGAHQPGLRQRRLLVPTTAVGNKDLTEEYIDAYEVAYTGNIGDRATISAATYYTEFKDSIFFTPTGVWTTPPPGFPA